MMKRTSLIIMSALLLFTACGQKESAKEPVRKEIGLPELPPTVLSNDKAKADLDKILTLTGFDKITQE